MRDKIKWFWQYWRQYRYVLFVLLFFTPIQACFWVSVPRLIEFTVDYVKLGKMPENVIARWLIDTGAGMGLSVAATLAGTLALVALVAAVLYAFVQGHRTWMNCRFEWHFRQNAFINVTTKGPDFFTKFRTGDLVTRMTDDVADKLSWFACSGIFRFYEALLMVLFTIVMMVTIDPWLTMWVAGPLPIIVFIFFRSSSLLDKRYDHLQTRISAFNDVMEACFSGVRVIKSYVREAAQRTRFGKAAEERRQAEINTIKVMTVVESMYGYVWQFGIIIVLLVGGNMVIQSNLSLGKLVAFVYYVVYLVFPMFDVGQFLVKSRQSAVSIDRLVELEKVAPMVVDSGKLRGNGSIHGRLTFEDVSFSFPLSERKILDGITLEIQPGQTVAVVGRVGSGKSWLVNMIPRLVDPSGGTIKLDGHDLRQFRLDDLRQNIGYVPQEPVLFSDTVANNIRFGREEISDSVMEWAIDVAQLKNEVATFPKGLDTAIGTRGVAISGGQKQRLALARALVGKPKILILDDCTSALDSRTEAALWERLHEVMPEMTAILITHRPDTLERADMIFVLDDGRVVETGRHYDLMAQGGHYARIYKRYQLEEAVG